jgi:2'-5' RNA ligase
MAIRSFLAFELPPGIKDMVTRVSEEVMRSSLNVRWVNVDNIHLTVVFMGNIRSEDIPEMGEAIAEVCSGFGPFDISLKGLGVFPNARRPRVLWLGLNGDIEKMASLRDRLQEMLRPFGIKEEKRTFKPHLTLGRFRTPGKMAPGLEDIIARYKGLESPICRMGELILFMSELKPGGAEYTKIKSWPLLTA